ncbi:MAG: hypothetical protein JXO22_10830 [Phycisphaerae bacterium]|nr:hypothetical protein [Phycisphaerae bacterium]
MNILWLLAVCGVALALGGWLYAPLIARVLGERRDRPTPAVELNDGRDYVPTRTPVVFAHHYASIAGAGPIIGPILAIYYGWGPALLWIVLGGIFLGGVHDYVATHMAVREGGKNLAIVTRRYVGPAAFVMMLVMLVALLVLVCSAFLDASAKALTSKESTEALQLDESGGFFRVEDTRILAADAAIFNATTNEQDMLAALKGPFGKVKRPLTEAAVLTTIEAGREWQLHDADRTYVLKMEQDAAGVAKVTVWLKQAILGGIASMSVIVITVFSPLIGYLYLKRKVPVWICSLLAVGICALSIVVGIRWPVALDPLGWKLGISAYVLISAGLPVWLFLQSRDFINVHILYVGIVFLIVALVAAGIRGGGAMADGVSIPMNNLSSASGAMGPAWPVLFVTIACGAVSGFHSLCAGGTTCKQLRTEVAARHVGYYAMLLESFLAVCVVACVIVGLTKANYVLYARPGAAGGNAVLTFAMSVGHTAHIGLGLPVAAGALGAMLLLEGFLVTTLDTAIRLTRYMIEEGWATFFGKYDVFADKAARLAETEPEQATAELIGTGGLTGQRPDFGETTQPGPIIATSGLLRGVLSFLRHYWVNSGIAVALMLLLALTNGYQTVWKIFGSANQLLAALVLLVASCWLAAHRRPIWYTLLPALFMLVTSITMVVRLLTKDYLPGWPGTAPLAVAAIVVLAMTMGILWLMVNRWVLNGPRSTVPAK